MILKAQLLAKKRRSGAAAIRCIRVLKAPLLQKRRSEAAAIRRIMDVKASPLVLTSFIRAPHNKINNL